jgi:hypothetical protein
MPFGSQAIRQEMGQGQGNWHGAFPCRWGEDRVQELCKIPSRLFVRTLVGGCSGAQCVNVVLVSVIAAGGGLIPWAAHLDEAGPDHGHRPLPSELLTGSDTGDGL